MLKTAVLISGRGSNMQALIDDMKLPGAPYRVSVVISNKLDAPGLDKARAAGVPAEVVNYKVYGTREAFERELDMKLNDYGVQLVVLAGFMRLLTPWFVERWRDRMINIHPSLLPLYPGLNTHKRAIDAGDKQAGCTVLFVRPEMDVGPIILQASVPIQPGDTPEVLADRVLKEEHKIYPAAVRLIAENRVNVFDEHVLLPAPMRQRRMKANPLMSRCPCQIRFTSIKIDLQEIIMASHSEPQVPAALMRRRRNDWHHFTRAIIYNCIAVGSLLLFLLLVFRIL